MGAEEKGDDLISYFVDFNIFIKFSPCFTIDNIKIHIVYIYIF